MTSKIGKSMDEPEILVELRTQARPRVCYEIQYDWNKNTVTNKIMHISIYLYSWKDQLKKILTIIPENENDVI